MFSERRSFESRPMWPSPFPTRFGPVAVCSTQHLSESYKMVVVLSLGLPSSHHDYESLKRIENKIIEGAKPRWSPQNRPYVVTSKPANEIGLRRDCFYLAAVSFCKARFEPSELGLILKASGCVLCWESLRRGRALRSDPGPMTRGWLRRN